MVCMLCSFNCDEKHVKIASIGCTAVEKCKSLYTQAMEMRGSRCAGASPTLPPCSSGFTGHPEALERATLFLTVLRLNFRYATPLFF